MTEEMARLALAALLRDGYGRPEGTVAYVYCTGGYAVFLRIDTGEFVLLDMEAVSVYRTTHRPAGMGDEHGAQQGQD